VSDDRRQRGRHRLQPVVETVVLGVRVVADRLHPHHPHYQPHPLQLGHRSVVMSVRTTAAAADRQYHQSHHHHQSQLHHQSQFQLQLQVEPHHLRPHQNPWLLMLKQAGARRWRPR
jgi:hypothetical protein